MRSSKGLQLLRCLEELDLGANLIASIHDIVRLSGAPLLPSQPVRHRHALACHASSDPLRLSGTLLPLHLCATGIRSHAMQTMVPSLLWGHLSVQNNEPSAEGPKGLCRPHCTSGHAPLHGHARVLRTAVWTVC